MSSLKTKSTEFIYHRLAKTLKFSTTKMQCAQDNQEDFTWVVMWARKVKEKEVDKRIWDNVELLSQVTREQLAKHQATMKFTNTPNPNNKMNISQWIM